MGKNREIVLSGKDYQRISQHLLQGSAEQLAVALATPNQGRDHLKLIVQEIIPVPREGLREQTPTYLEATDEFIWPILARCRREGKSLIEFHSHPFAGSNVGFSSVDDESDLETFIYVAEKFPEIYHATVVMGRSSIGARMWSREVEAVVPIHAFRVVELPLRIIPTTTAGSMTEAYSRLVSQGCLPPRGRGYNWEAVSRQVQAFGREGQERLRQNRVAVVGIGGIGSVVAATLGHVGIGRLLLIDPEGLEKTNLNRWLGASAADARSGASKVAAAKAYIMKVNPEAEVETFQSSVFAPEAIEALRGADVVFGCGDKESVRLVLNRLATQYCIPYIDCGSGLFADGNSIEAAGGQIRVVLPDGPCLECMDGIDRPRAALELMSPADREVQARRGYVVGANIPAPSVMPLN